MGDTNGQIEKCIIFIKDHVTDVDSVADKLIEKGVLKMSERESIVGNKSPREQIQGIVSFFKKLNQNSSFIIFLFKCTSCI
jgi:translation elongation factor EF-Tu-like GTPase